MQCWIINKVENLWQFLQDSSINKKLNKNSIYLKYNFCNNIHDCSKAWGQYFIYIYYFKEMCFYSARIC